MKLFYITGTSSGIGKAIAEELLLNSSNRVVGISRKNTIQHPHFTFLQTDLSDIKQIERIDFSINDKIENVTLINNAGLISEIKYSGRQKSSDIEHDILVNLTAPLILINKFLSVIATIACEKNILNISSGAGRNPVDGWSVYCATKAGLNMHSKVIALEQKGNVRVKSIAPGVVDTGMQTQIRGSAESDFSRINDFINYKEQGILLTPQMVAERLVANFEKIMNSPEILVALKDF